VQTVLNLKKRFISYSGELGRIHRNLREIKQKAYDIHKWVFLRLRKRRMGRLKNVR